MDNKLVYIIGAGITIIAIISVSVFIMNSEATVEQDEPNYTVEYFKEHEQEREAMLKQCEVTDAALFEANCINAAEASDALMRERARKEAEELYGQ